MKTHYHTLLFLLFFFTSTTVIKGQTYYDSKFLYPSLEIGVNYPILSNPEIYRPLRRHELRDGQRSEFKIGNIFAFELPFIESNRFYLSGTIGMMNLQLRKIAITRGVINENRKKSWNPYIRLNGGFKFFGFSKFALALQGHAGWAFAKYPTLQANTFYWDGPANITDPITYKEVSFSPNLSLTSGASIVLKYWVNQRLQLGFNAGYSIWLINQEQKATTYRGGLPESQKQNYNELIQVPNISVSFGYALFDK